MSPKQLAESILKKYWDGQLPVDPAVLARALKAEVIDDPSLSLTSASGQFDFENGRPVIRYTSVEPSVRQRFTIAHELGHYVLGHEGLFRDPSKNFSATNYDSKEVAANKFAAELLMPKEEVNRLIKDDKITDLSKLAQRFNVSEVAMKFRLQNLGWIS